MKSRDLIGRIRQNRNLPMGMVLGVDSLIGVLGNSSSLLNLLSNVVREALCLALHHIIDVFA